MEEEVINGLSMRVCAEIMSREGELKAQYGEREAAPHFDQYLAQRGIAGHAWGESWNGWWARMEADPSCMLHAKFSVIQRKLSMAAHMADVPDMSQEQREGVSLDTYAQMMAQVAAGGDFPALLAHYGLVNDQWQRAQEAWNAEMADVNIATQYGMLYSKNVPEEQAIAQAAAGLVEAKKQAAERAANEEPEVEWTFEMSVAELDSPDANKRWTAARHVCVAWDIGDREENPALVPAAQRTIDLFIDCLEHHDANSASNAESSAGCLVTYAKEGFLGDKAGDAEHAMGMCLNRAREKLATLEAAFEPIRDKKVPERITMQSQIQDFTSLVEELTDMVADWADNLEDPPEPSSSVSAAPGASAIQPASVSAPATGGFMGILRSLPIIGNIVRMLGL